MTDWPHHHTWSGYAPAVDGALGKEATLFLGCIADWLSVA